MRNSFKINVVYVIRINGQLPLSCHLVATGADHCFGQHPESHPGRAWTCRLPRSLNRPKPPKLLRCRMAR